MYIPKFHGPKTEPCRTPQTSLASSEIIPSISTHCVRSCKYDFNRDNAGPDIPKVSCQRSNNTA